jgi:hypothetical protein
MATTTPTPDLADLERQAAEAEALAAAARQQIDEHHARVAAAREAAERDYDQRRLDAYDQAALDTAVDTARARLRDAVAADPVYRAYVDLLAAEIARKWEWHEISAIAKRLGARFPGSHIEPGYAGTGPLDDLAKRIADDLARERDSARQDALAAARQAAADKAAAGIDGQPPATSAARRR